MSEHDYTIAEWCRKRRWTKPTYYKNKKLGLTPRELRVGCKVTITAAADEEWEQKMAKRASSKEQRQIDEELRRRAVEAQQR